MAFHEGTRIGPYEIVGQIGAGGMGEVWKAKDTRLGRDVAIKVLPSDFAEDAGLVRRFHQEAKVLASMNHANVVQVFEAGEHEGSPYLVMELLSGETLRERLRGKSIPPKRAAEIAREAALGLATAHEKGILHRDLKPENLFLMKDGHVKVLDFGLAKFEARKPIGQESATRAYLSEPGTVVGTSGYMSPEQVLGETLDHRSDLFSLGVVLWEMLAGHRPFEGDSSVEVMHAILKDDPPELEEALKVPPALERILRSCLAKEPAGRFHSAHDLAFALESISTTIDSQVPATGIRPAPRLQKALRLALVVLPVLLAVGALLVWKPWRPAPPPFDPRCVAILPFENRTGDRAFDALGQRVVDLLRQDLQPVDDLKVAADQPLPQGSGSPEKRLAEATKAHYVVAGACYLKGGELELQGRLEDPWTGKVIYQLGPWKAPKEDPDQALNEMRQVLGGAVAWAYGESERLWAGTRPPRLEALLALRKGADKFGRDYAAVIAGAEQALALDPEFFDARVTMFFALANQDRWEEASRHLVRVEADYGRLTPVERAIVRWERAGIEGRDLEVLKVFEDLKAIHPETDNLRLNRSNYELRVNRPGSAIRSLKGIRLARAGRRVGADYWPTRMLCQAYHLAGDYSAELRTAREAQTQYPDVLVLRAYEAEALAALGRVKELEPVFQSAPTVVPRPRTGNPADVMITAVLEMRAHGHRKASQQLAARFLAEYRSFCESPPPEEMQWVRSNLEFFKPLETHVPIMLVHLDRGDEALEIYRGLLAKNPNDVNHQGVIGALLARLGRVQEARKVEAELAALTRPYLFGQHTFWRACIAAQLGEKDRAVALLGQSLGQGFKYFMDIHREINLESLHGYPPYEALMKPKD